MVDSCDVSSFGGYRLYDMEYGVHECNLMTLDLLE
jgi:hypothetical protein